MPLSDGFPSEDLDRGRTERRRKAMTAVDRWFGLWEASQLLAAPAVLAGLVGFAGTASAGVAFALLLGAAFAVTTLPGCLAGLAVARNYDVLPRGMIALGLLPWGILVVEATGLIAAISLTV